MTSTPHDRGPFDITWQSWAKLGVSGFTVLLGACYTILLLTGRHFPGPTGFLIGLVYAAAAFMLHAAREDAHYDQSVARHDDARRRDQLVAALYAAGSSYDRSVPAVQWFATWLRSDAGVAALTADQTIAGKLGIIRQEAR